MCAPYAPAWARQRGRHVLKACAERCMRRSDACAGICPRREGRRTRRSSSARMGMCALNHLFARVSQYFLTESLIRFLVKIILFERSLLDRVGVLKNLRSPL